MLGLSVKEQTKKKNNKTGPGDIGPIFTHRKREPWAIGGKSFWASVIVFVLTTAVIGAGIYFYQAYFYQRQIESLTKQIEILNEQVEVVTGLLGVRELEETDESFCPTLEISKDKKTVIANGEALVFTTLSAKGAEIVSVIGNPDCKRFAYSTVSFLEDQTESKIFVSDYQGNDIRDYVVYELFAHNINFKEFKEGQLLFTHAPYGSKSESILMPAVDTAVFDTADGSVKEWGRTYAYSLNWHSAVIDREGSSVLRNLEEDEDIAVLAKLGEDYAGDFVFSEDGETITYLYFTKVKDDSFLHNYFEYNNEEVVIDGIIRIWDIKTGTHTGILSGNMKGIRLDSLQKGVLSYTKWEPGPVERMLVLP